MFHVGDRVGFIPSGPVSLDETRHTAVFGGSGSGKSTFLTRLAIHHVRKGDSLLVIDPHGTFVDAILQYVPAERLRDVIVFDPLSDKPIGLPTLKPKDELSADVAIQLLAEQLGEQSFMGRSRMFARNLLYGAVHVLDKPTLFHLWLMFIFDAFAIWILGRDTNVTIQQWARLTYEKTPDKQRLEAEAAPFNKTDALFALQTLRHIYAQPDGLDLFDAIQNRKIVVCVLRKGQLGEEAANLLGSNILRLLLSAILQRDPAESNPFLSVIVDEFHNFTKGTSPEAFFAETRKYSVAFTVADQSPRQLPDGATDYLFPNVSNLLTFRLSAKDAAELAEEVGAPSENVLTTLPTGEFFMKNVFPSLVRTGVWARLPQRFASHDRKKKHPLFLPPKLGNEPSKGDCYAYSTAHYGRSRADVDEIINRELAAALAAERRTQ